MSAAPEAKFTEEKVLWVKHYTPKLMTFAITRPEAYRFSAGQFSRLGFRDGEGFIWRAYSVVSAEYADTLEYFTVLIESGPMSAKLAAMQAGDTILLDKTATGFLLPERFPDGRDLVMLCTGSGIAPFLSILEQPEIWQRFEHLVLVHSVSYAGELIFNERLAALQSHPLIGEFFSKFRFIPVTTREETAGALGLKRIPALLSDGTLEAASGLEFDQENTRFMVCGNPEMVKDTFQALLDLGFAMHRNRIPGQIMMENGFS
ncbi:ferredoxin--NADP reductase [Neisseria chenwenguii]|uniref:ferredoxin--NADP(+) reductase n=1 Tax=Neisseria chenwenguii TaxID=1853278 RepID=A0A220S007_9NEIS|nr:ferredoxin--NADP reductase [Neisseria chenwenguii]ASK26718.1 ferredoxin--NADP(+) reductase [Neisseria chenwenguii]ROV56380.1 ferredoxin--NADP reductase [Neisseria chenwenguii]